ncbi:ATP-dependent DNA helicase [Thiocapsa sp. UBA6158]|uniref:ATP-dependent DNA helicase n=1 Tax=Thiocapsa sp. UBA6158 TaxID=1947692 RepID=UPI0025CB93C6|nr:AAA family ATPase [Thiocapsa sp. UBA6158]
MSQLITLSAHQQEALEAIQHFLLGDGDCFILQGGAGTGKTTLLAALAQWLKAVCRPHMFLAPTGRAARILGDKTGARTSTIHACIFRLAQLDVFEGAQAKNDPGLRFRFALKTDDPGNSLFVVDESSMVGDIEDKQDMLRFGSGRLLADLVEFTRIGRPGRGNADSGAKLLFVGDPAQLPPVGQKHSPALSIDYLQTEFALSCTGFELTEVHRQEAGSLILERATAIRNAIKTKRFTTFSLKPNDDAILAAGVPESIERVSDGYRKGGASSVLITYTNAKALEFNRAVRARLWGNEQADIRARDQLLVNHNSHGCGLYNGDLVRVRDVAERVQRRTVAMRGAEPVDLRFREATVAYKDSDGAVQQIECLLLENLLDSKERALSPLEQRALLVDFRQRYPELKPGTEAFGLTIRQDPWFNALQVKYGYAVTCHKAQGGEWDTAVVLFESGRGINNEDFFRWAYTAITRAKRTLVTIAAPACNAYSAMDWDTNPAPAKHAESIGQGEPEHRDDPDWDRYNFSRDHAGIFVHHCKVRDALQAQGISVDAVQHLQYCERYQLRRDEAMASVQYWYKGNGQVSRIEPAAGNRSGDAALIDVAVGLMMEALLKVGAEGQAVENPFVHAFVQQLERSTADAGLRILSKRDLPYRLRIEISDGTRHGAIDFCYDNTPKWIRVQEVGGAGKSQGLIDRIRSLLQEM